MKQTTKKFLTLALSLTLAFTAAAPVTAQAEVTSCAKSYNVYKQGPGKSVTSIYLNCTKKSDTIKKASVKTSNKNVARPYYLEKSTSSWQTEYFDKNISQSSNSSQSYYLGLEVNKVGKATISFKAGTKNYKTTINVKKYVSPVKSLTITGVNGGKNLASKLKTESYYSEKLKKTTKNVVVKATGNTGWRVTSIEVNTNGYSDDYRVSNYGKKGVTKGTLKAGSLAKNKGGTIWVYFADKTGATQSLYINLY